MSWNAESDEDMIEIKYVDGKPVRVKKNISDEIKKELHEPQEANPFDATKRELYAELPQAQAKRDRSITARSLNTTLESYKKVRFETRYKRTDSNGLVFYSTSGWSFEWDRNQGILRTIKVPSGSLKMTFTSTKLKNDDENFVIKKIEEHLERDKAKKTEEN